MVRMIGVSTTYMSKVEREEFRLRPTTRAACGRFQIPIPVVDADLAAGSAHAFCIAPTVTRQLRGSVGPIVGSCGYWSNKYLIMLRFYCYVGAARGIRTPDPIITN
jgi:hypothetical protein